MNRPASKKQEPIAAEETAVEAMKAPQLPSIMGAPEEEVLLSMIKLPRLSLCQKMSKAVEAEKAKVGDLYENLQGTVVSPKDKPFTFIPLKLRNVITTYRISGPKKDFVSQMARTKANELKEWDETREEIIDGKKIISQFKHLPETQVYMVSAEDIEKGNLVLPMLFTFRGASMPAGGKAIYTQKLLLDSSGIPFFAYKFKMTSERGEKNGNTYQVAVVERLNDKTDAPTQEICKRWVDTINSMRNVEVTEDDDVSADLGGNSQGATIKEQF